MKLFAALYLDEDVDVLVATLMTARGFDAVTARDQGLLETDDAIHLQCASSLDRSIFTHNRLDFEELHTEYVAEGKTHSDIIIGTRRNAYELAQRLARLLNALTADEIANQLLYV